MRNIAYALAQPGSNPVLLLVKISHSHPLCGPRAEQYRRQTRILSVYALVGIAHPVDTHTKSMTGFL